MNTAGPLLPAAESLATSRITPPTAARPARIESAHWYHPNGTPCFEVPRANGSGMRPTTLADARKLSLFPSVTTLLKTLNKPALNDWLIEQGLLACLTSPRADGEGLDAFVHRILHVERVQDQEASLARDLGTDMHAGMAALFRGERIEDDLRPWIEPAYQAVKRKDSLWQVETVVVGDGYAGTVDLIQSTPDAVLIVDWKTTKKLPKSAWPEHLLQLGAYAKAYQDPGERPITTANVYISTVDCGKFTICVHGPWHPAAEAFRNLVALWQWQNSYTP